MGRPRICENDYDGVYANVIQSLRDGDKYDGVNFTRKLLVFYYAHSRDENIQE